MGELSQWRVTGLVICGFFCCSLLSQADAEDTTTIAAFGDSLVAGYGLLPDDAFPAQLARKLTQDGYKITMLNDGISGDTTAGGMARVNAVLEQKPGLVIIVLGGNDLLHGTPPAEVRSNLDSILASFHAAHIKMLVAGQKAPFTYGIKYAGDYNPIFCELAKKYDASCYPFFLEDVYNKLDLMQPDGIHPNTQGVAFIVGKMYPAVEKLLKK